MGRFERGLAKVDAHAAICDDDLIEPSWVDELVAMDHEHQKRQLAEQFAAAIGVPVELICE